jgi:polygalacturonase
MASEQATTIFLEKAPDLRSSTKGGKSDDEVERWSIYSTFVAELLSQRCLSSSIWSCGMLSREIALVIDCLEFCLEELLKVAHSSSGNLPFKNIGCGCWKWEIEIAVRQKGFKRIFGEMDRVCCTKSASRATNVAKGDIPTFSLVEWSSRHLQIQRYPRVKLKKGITVRGLSKSLFRTFSSLSILLLAVLVGVSCDKLSSQPSKILEEQGHNNWIWSSLNCPSRSLLKPYIEQDLHCCCSIRDHGAVGDNTTMNTAAIQETIDSCHEICFRVSRRRSHDNTKHHGFSVMIYIPPGNFQTGSILLKSNIQFHLARGATLYGSTHTYDYPIVSMLPNGYVTGKAAMWRALIAGYNLINVSITGENDGAPDRESIIDGVGWKWWCWARSFPLPQDYCRQLNPSNATIPKQIMRPKLIEFYNSTNIMMKQFTAQNSPNWNIHPFACQNVIMKNLTVLSPRAIGNTDGIDPDSCIDVVMDSCYIDVGDDAVSIKSTNATPGVMWPTNNVYMNNLTILSRNWCIGSATFGGISNILLENSRIGSTDEVTSPWAIKFKSHRYFPGPMENITIRNVVIGKIGPTPWMYPTFPGYAFQVGLSYSDSHSQQRSGSPLFRNVTFEDIVVITAGVAGSFHGLPEDCLQGLILRNVSVLGGEARWTCDNVDLSSFIGDNVFPSLICNGGCNKTVDTTLVAQLDELAATYR